MRKKTKPTKAKPSYEELYANSQRELASCQIQLIATLIALGRPITIPIGIIQAIVPGVDFAVSWRDTTAAGDFLILQHKRVIKEKDASKGPPADSRPEN